MIVFGRTKVKARTRHFDGALRRRVGVGGAEAEAEGGRRQRLSRIDATSSSSSELADRPRQDTEALSERGEHAQRMVRRRNDMAICRRSARRHGGTAVRRYVDTSVCRYVGTSVRRPVGPSARRKRGDRVGIGSRARTARDRSRACPAALVRAGRAGRAGTFRGSRTNARCRAKGRRRPARRRDARARGVRYSVVRTCQSSGNSTTSSILRRYGAPLVPPVPCLKPMMRSTVVT